MEKFVYNFIMKYINEEENPYSAIKCIISYGSWLNRPFFA